MEPDKLSALLKGQLTQQDYLTSQNEIVANPTQGEAPELDTKSEVVPKTSAATPESGSEFDPESENESEESSAESDDEDEDDDDDDDDDDESEGESDEDEDDENEESEADDSSKSGTDNSPIPSETFKAEVNVKADVGLNFENGADKEGGDGLKEKLEINGGKPHVPPANGDVSVEQQMDFKDDLDVKDEGALIAGEIVPSGKTFESDPDLMSAISDPKFGEELGISNGSDSILKTSDVTAADGEQSKSEAGGKEKEKEKSTKPKRKRKRAAEGGEKSEKKKKKRKKEDGEKKKKGKNSKKSNERKNIRKIFKEGDLDENTITAQQEEKERKERLAALQRNVASNMHLKALLETDSGEEEEAKEDIVVLDKGDQVKRTGKYAAFKPARDVIELSSDDEDDDVTVLETPEEEIEIEDPNNSGLHVDDTLNVPDEQGRVLVNVGHPGDEPDIFLAPQIAKVIKPHQIGGIRFLYDNLVESVNRFRTSHGFGCILAHSMGLGKTIQMVSFIDIFLRNTDAKSVLVIVPINTLQNWLNEFSMWIPEVPNPDETMKDQIWPREFYVHLINDNHKTTKARAAVIQTWMKKGGVLLMGYEMYRLLATRKATKAKRKPGRKSANSQVIDLEEEDRNRELAMDIQTALLRPGPDLVICDEGHRIKNSHASISQALKNIRTRRRVVLTGYPLQNNLVEYWCMVDFVRPNYLGNKAEFCNMFERPIMNGQCVDSTPNDARLMRHRAHVLHSLLEGFVQRRGHAVLKDALPTKVEHVLFIRMSPVQRKLYRLFMDSLTEMALSGWATVNPLKAFSVCCKIWNHPDILYRIVKQMRSDAIEDDLDLGETADGKAGEDGVSVKKPRGRKKKAPTQPTPVFDPVTGRPFPDVNLFSDRRMETITYEWADDVIKTYSPGDLVNGGKMVILFNIIEETIRAGEKLLVFSQSLFTLNLMEEFLGRRKVPDSNDKWAKNKHYFRLDGSTSSQEREKLINLFNAPSNENVHLFLLSTRAGCLGINLVGASRVVVFDASWNPCHDCQAVCRVYRYGQTKPCYIYRLVTDNTLEKKIYERQINKQGMADRVVDEMNPQNNFTKRQVESLLHYEDQDLPVMNIECVENLTDPVMRLVLKDYSVWLTKDPFTHESLLIDQQDLRLTKAEKKLARQSYEREKKMSLSSYQRPSYQAYYPKPGEMAGASNSYRSGMPRTLSLATSLPNPGSLPPPQSMATPVPMTLKKGTPGFGKGFDLSTGHSMNHTGVTVNQVITTTEIVVPATTTSTDTTPQIKIPPGKQILVIKTQKGVYIRTPEGKIFAVRGGGGPGARSATASKPLGMEVTTVTGTTSTATVSTANSNSNADSMTGYDSRSSGSPRVPSSVLDLMDGSSQDSMSSSTASGMTGLLRSALMKGRQEAASHPPGPSVQPSVAPSPLTAQFSSLSTSSHHASPVPFTQGATMPHQSSHQASPVPFTQSHSRFGASPMESLVSMATSKSQKLPTSEEGESAGQESEQTMSGTKIGSMNVPGYNSMIDYQSPTYPGSSQRLPTTTTSTFVEPKLSSQLSGCGMPKKLVDPYKMPVSGRKHESSHSVADLLNTNRRSAPDDDLMKSGYDETMEDYDSGDSSGMSGLFPDVDFDTPMPGVAQALPASTSGPLGVKQMHGSRLPVPQQIQRQMFDHQAVGRGRGMIRSHVGSAPNRKEEAGMSSLRAVQSDPPLGTMSMEESGPRLGIADYQRAVTKPAAGKVLMGRGESRMAFQGSHQGVDTMEESSGPPLSIADYQRGHKWAGSSSGTTQALGGGLQRPGTEKMDEPVPPLTVADYQRLLTQTDKGTKPYSGGNLDGKHESGVSSLGCLQSPGSESMEDSGSPLSIADYQRLINRTADNKPNVGADANRKQEYGMSSLSSLRATPSPGSESMEDSGPPLSIADYQRLVSQTAKSSVPKTNMGTNRKEESGILPPSSQQETQSPGSESMEDSGSPLGIADYQRLLSRTASSIGAKADIGTESDKKDDYGMPPVGSLREIQSPGSESMDSGPPLSIADYQRLIDRTAADKGTKPNIGRDPNRKQESGIKPRHSVQKTQCLASELLDDSGPPLGITDYQQLLKHSADNAGTRPNKGGPPNRSRESGLSSLGSLLDTQSPESERMEDSGPPLSIADYQRLLTKTADTTSAKAYVGTDSNRTQKAGVSSLGPLPDNPSPRSDTMEDTGPPLSIADYQRLIDQTEASVRCAVGRESQMSQFRNPGTAAGNVGMENFGQPSSGPKFHRSISHPAPSLATSSQISTDQNRMDGTRLSSVVDPIPASGSLEDSGPPLSIADYQRALSRTLDSNPMNRAGDNVSIDMNINLRPPAPVQAINVTSKKKGKANPPLGASAPKNGKKRGPKPGSTRKKATKKNPDVSQPAFGGQMGLQQNQQGPVMSQVSMNMRMRHPFMGNQPGLSHSLSDSGQVGTNYGRAGPRPIGRDHGSVMSFGYEGSHGQIDQDNFGEGMNMPAVSQSPSLDRMFDSDSNSGQDQNQSLMMDYLGKRAANSPLNQDRQGLGTSHLGMARGNLVTNMRSSMDMDMVRNYSNPQKQENFDIIQQLYQNDSLSKSSDLFPGEDTLQSNELANFLSKENMVSSSATHRPSSELSGLYSSPSTATTSSSMSMGSSGRQDSSGRLSSRLGNDSRNRLPGVGADSRGRMAGYMGAESGNMLPDSSHRITSSGSGGNVSGLGYGVSVKQEDSRGRLSGMGNSSGRLPGMGSPGSRLPGMSNFSHGFSNTGMMNNYSDISGMSGNSGDGMSGLGDSNNPYTGMSDSNNLTGYQDSNNRLGVGESNTRHSGLNDTVYSQSQSDFGASQSYLDQMTTRSTGQEYASMSSQPQSSPGTLPSFNSSYMQSASEMNMSQPWMGSTMGYESSYGVQNTDVYRVPQGASLQENMNWSNYNFPNQTTQGNPSQSLMSGSMEKNA